jgi:hypothetical protein
MLEGRAGRPLATMWPNRLANVFLDFVEFPETGELLDVGCGTGALTLAMAQRWPARRSVSVLRLASGAAGKLASACDAAVARTVGIGSLQPKHDSAYCRLANQSEVRMSLKARSLVLTVAGGMLACASPWQKLQGGNRDIREA